MIELENIWLHYGVRPVLRGINLRVQEGELLCVMGPNGMGKSTLLGVMAGVLAPVKGQVQIDGLRRRQTGQYRAVAVKPRKKGQVVLDLNSDVSMPSWFKAPVNLHSRPAN